MSCREPPSTAYSNPPLQGTSITLTAARNAHALSKSETRQDTPLRWTGRQEESGIKIDSNFPLFFSVSTRHHFTRTHEKKKSSSNGVVVPSVVGAVGSVNSTNGVVVVSGSCVVVGASVVVVVSGARVVVGASVVVVVVGASVVVNTVVVVSGNRVVVTSVVSLDEGVMRFVTEKSSSPASSAVPDSVGLAVAVTRREIPAKGRRVDEAEWGRGRGREVVTVPESSVWTRMGEGAGAPVEGITVVVSSPLCAAL